MNFDFTPPQPDFTPPPKEATETPSETPNEAPHDWIAAALPPQEPQAPQPALYSPIPAPGAPPPQQQAPQQQGDGTGGLIPYKNPMALLGYRDSN